MSGKASSTSAWLKFFRGAGIPTGIDTKYALLFDENRIKMDMLMDLDKEILRDMGIIAMGDIIAILKHARKVHDETKEQAVEPNKPTQSQSPNPSAACGKSTPENTTQPAAKVVSKAPIVVSSKPELKPTAGSSSSSKVKSASLPHQTIRMIGRAEQNKSTATETVRKSVEHHSETTVERKMIVLNKRSNAESPLREEVPLQKKIRVLPEHEGKYKIKMPDGLIPRTQKVIQSRLGPSVTELSSAKDKKNVFERLGESKVSSSTEDKQPTSNSSSSSRLESSKDNSKLSVFERLGDRGRLGESTKTPITLSSSVTKPLIQTKVDIHQTTLPAKSKYDPKVYMEKTLMTIPSRISIPYMNKSRLKSEIIAPVTSSSTTTTRIISAKSSATSTQSQRESPFRPAKELFSRSLTTRSYSDESQNQSQRVRFRGISDIEASLHDDKMIPPSSSSPSTVSSYSKASSSQDKWKDAGPVDGQVLQTIRMPSKNKGKVIVKRLIYKKVPKSATATSNFDLDLLPDIDDPLADCYQDVD